MPVTGGSNVPALNVLLAPWKIALGDRVFDGDFAFGDRDMYFATGTALAHFPDHGHVVRASLSDLGHEMLEGETKIEANIPILGLLQTKAGNLFDVTEDEKVDDANPINVERKREHGTGEKLNVEMMNMDDAEHNVGTEVDSLDVFRHNHNLDVNNNNHDHHLNEDENSAKENQNILFDEKTNPLTSDLDVNKSHAIPEVLDNSLAQHMRKPRSIGHGTTHDGGRVIVYGDSNCLDSSHLQKDCLWLLAALLEYSMAGHLAGVFMSAGATGRGVGENYNAADPSLPRRMEHSTLHKHSKVGLREQLVSFEICACNSILEWIELGMKRCVGELE